MIGIYSGRILIDGKTMEKLLSGFRFRHCLPERLLRGEEVIDGLREEELRDDCCILDSLLRIYDPSGISFRTIYL